MAGQFGYGSIIIRYEAICRSESLVQISHGAQQNSLQINVLIDLYLIFKDHRLFQPAKFSKVFSRISHNEK